MLRRSLLKMFGAAPVAVPMLGSAATASGVGAAGLGILPTTPVITETVKEGVLNMAESRFDKSLKSNLATKAKNALLKTLRPQWWLDDIAEDAKRESIRAIIDSAITIPDYNFNLMALKSVSPAAKHLMVQKHMAIKREKAMGNWSEYRLQKMMFEKANGFEDTDDY